MKVVEQICRRSHLLYASYCVLAASLDQTIKQRGISLYQLIGNFIAHPFCATGLVGGFHTLDDGGGQTFHKNTAQEFALSRASCLLIYELYRHAQRLEEFYKH